MMIEHLSIRGHLGEIFQHPLIIVALPIAARKMNLATFRLRAQVRTVLVQCHGTPPIHGFVPNIPMAAWVLEEGDRHLASMDAVGVDILPGVDVGGLTWDLPAALPMVPGVATWVQRQAVEVAVE
jgi:hypothetical protein